TTLFRSEFHFRLAELGGLAGEPDSAGKCQLATAAEGEAVYGTDGRLSESFEEMKDALAEERKILAVEWSALRQFADVSTGDERFFSRAGENQHADGGVVAHFEQRVAQL